MKERKRSAPGCVATYLSEEGFALEARHDYASGPERTRSDTHAMAVLDVMLEGRSGLDLLRELRTFSDLPDRGGDS